MRCKGFGGSIKTKAWGWKKMQKKAWKKGFLRDDDDAPRKFKWYEAKRDHDRDDDGDFGWAKGCGARWSKRKHRDDDGCGDRDGWKKGGFKKVWKSKDKDICGPGDKRPSPPDEDFPLPEEPSVNKAPVFTAPTPSVATSGAVATAGDAVVQLLAEDPDGDALVFSIMDADGVESADGDFFQVDRDSGMLIWRADAAIGGSADGDNVYEVEIMVSDGQLNDIMQLDVVMAMGA